MGFGPQPITFSNQWPRSWQAGARTIVQDEKSSVVFGMPKAAIELGAADQVVALNRISAKIIDWIEQIKNSPAKKAG
ncbi:hypothetical protein EBZ37_10240 [bacterium]|nr:hypothetical protein [bacterium]